MNFLKINLYWKSYYKIDMTLFESHHKCNAKEMTPVLVFYPPFAEAGVQAAISCPERSLGAGPSVSSDSYT